MSTSSTPTPSATPAPAAATATSAAATKNTTLNTTRTTRMATVRGVKLCEPGSFKQAAGSTGKEGDDNVANDEYRYHKWFCSSRTVFAVCNFFLAFKGSLNCKSDPAATAEGPAWAFAFRRPTARPFGGRSRPTRRVERTSCGSSAWCKKLARAATAAAATV